MEVGGTEHFGASRDQATAVFKDMHSERKKKKEYASAAWDTDRGYGHRWKGRRVRAHCPGLAWLVPLSGEAVGKSRWAGAWAGLGDHLSLGEEEEKGLKTSSGSETGDPQEKEEIRRGRPRIESKTDTQT